MPHLILSYSFKKGILIFWISFQSLLIHGLDCPSMRMLASIYIMWRIGKIKKLMMSPCLLFLEINPNDRLILLTTIINWSCKITHKRDWKWSWTLNCINSVYNSQPCNNIGFWINRIHQGFDCMRSKSNLA